jgi:predicted nucleic acid-binding protein
VILPDVRPFLEETHALDPGEASAITLAWQHRDSSLLIMDEKRGRKVSQALGLHITGAAGLLCDAARVGLLDFEDAFRRLTQTRFRLSPAIVETLRQRHQDRFSPPET